MKEFRALLRGVGDDLWCWTSALRAGASAMMASACRRVA
jgi:hypothetical protein